ncbi:MULTISPECIES: HNH endonuclease [Streptomyces]|uniref:HNH endonuclease n=1 Tax=Streptomyces TaxID=1883 RepID=UPI001CCE12BC|nr:MULTISPECIES: HNH endonuclease [Streptomyces]UBI38074.1 HNH endonuclease [Streptomyces mobaraensis]UKW30661.1 HNH endonuclease [Streptomyces sp. TYQ1024]
MAAWLMLAVAEHKRAGDRYDDDPSTHYSWDDRVPNHAAVQVGDAIVLRDRDTLLGASIIESIEIGIGRKEIRSCPFCGKAGAAPRKRELPKYKCWKCKAVFPEPRTEAVDVTTYRSQHATGWVDLHGMMTVREMNGLCEKPKSQLSLRRLRWDYFRAAIENGQNPIPLRVLTNTRELLAGGHRTATIRARIGQPVFRKILLETFGETCAFTGPAPAQALEAAHLYSYAANGEHHKGGGLLLRRDLHRLFDLGLIAVNPRTKTLDISAELAPYPDYVQLHGALLAVTIAADHEKWLSKHWNMHRSAVQPVSVGGTLDEDG